MQEKDPDQFRRAEQLAYTIIQSKNKELYVLDAEIQKQKAFIEQKQAHISHLESVVVEYAQALQHQNDEVVRMQASRFWKLRKLFLTIRGQVFKNVKLDFGAKQHATSAPEAPTTELAANPSFRPRVSVIVPSFNHASYLKQRLDSIYLQSYDNFEVILLDDNSTDDSQKILLEYAHKYKANTRYIFNKINSGNVFAQWKLGIEAADGDLIWIAESDDYCDHNFLTELTKYFQDESVMLAYAYPEFVDTNGLKSQFTFDSYVSGLSPTKWAQTYVETAHNEVPLALGIKNTIPNVSGVVFRSIPVQEFDYEALKQFKVCGDWYFYLTIIRGGRLAFSRETKNYYRFHPSNTSSNYQKDLGFVKEHEIIAKHIAASYKIGLSVLRRNMQAVRTVWASQNPGREDAFYEAYDLASIKKQATQRKPNILIGVYAFTTGGGETVPIRLANALKNNQYAITMFDCHMAKLEEYTTRTMLDRGIPVVQRASMSLDSLLRDFGIEIIHTHHTTVDFLFSSRRNKKIPLVVTTHGLYETLPEKVVRRIEPRLNYVNYWVYVADKNLKPLEAYKWFSTKPIKKINNGFSPPATGSARLTRKQLAINDDAFILCLASRAMQQKGWREAIDAVNLANGLSRREIVLLLVGDGPIYEDLAKQELPNSIRLLGFQKDVFSYFSLSDIGILPTSYQGESCPMVLIECLAAHKPVIATDVGEIRSILTLSDGTIAGEIIELKGGLVNIPELSKAVLKVAGDSGYYIKLLQAASKRAGYFSTNRMVENYQKVYSELSGRL